jgi:hypothetical protein
VVILVGVILSNSKSRAVIELKLDDLIKQIEKHNQLAVCIYHPELTTMSG